MYRCAAPRRRHIPSAAGNSRTAYHRLMARHGCDGFIGIPVLSLYTSSVASFSASAPSAATAL